MASMCGPSNALSSLKNHTTTDRSLQQDHLQTPAPPPQIFRSQPADNQQLDNEFEQFTSNGGIPQDARLRLQHYVAAPRLDGWASDFQRMHISAPVAAPPLLQQQQQGWAVAGWHEEFMQHQQKPSHLAEPLMRGPSLGMYVGGFDQMYMGGGLESTRVMQMSNSQQQDITIQFDDAAFEQAFENAKAQLEESQDRKPLVVQDNVELVEVKIEEAKDKEHDSDELAKTAAQLLESLSGNQSQKFQDSTFLALMRRLRDREVKVEGDKMVETISAEPSKRPAAQLST